MIYLHGSFQPLSSNSKCNACPPCWAMSWAIRCAGLVEQTVQWQWSSLQHPTLADLPRFSSTLIAALGRPPLFDHELTALYTCLNRQAPFGSSDRLAQFAGVAGLDSTLRPRGRPRKTPDKSPDPLCFQRLTDSH